MEKAISSLLLQSIKAPSAKESKKAEDGKKCQTKVSTKANTLTTGSMEKEK